MSWFWCLLCFLTSLWAAGIQWKVIHHAMGDIVSKPKYRDLWLILIDDYIDRYILWSNCHKISQLVFLFLLLFNFSISHLGYQRFLFFYNVSLKTNQGLMHTIKGDLTGQPEVCDTDMLLPFKVYTRSTLANCCIFTHPANMEQC